MEMPNEERKQTIAFLASLEKLYKNEEIDKKFFVEQINALYDNKEAMHKYLQTLGLSLEV